LTLSPTSTLAKLTHLAAELERQPRRVVRGRVLLLAILA
jgi:hypothetical protein